MVGLKAMCLSVTVRIDIQQIHEGLCLNFSQQPFRNALRIGYNTVRRELCECIRANSLQSRRCCHLLISWL